MTIPRNTGTNPDGSATSHRPRAYRPESSHARRLSGPPRVGKTPQNGLHAEGLGAERAKTGVFRARRTNHPESAPSDPTRTRRQGRETLTATRPADTVQRSCTRCFGLLLSGADGFTRCASCGREEGWLERSLAPATKVVKGDTGPKVHPATAQRDFDGYRDANRRAEAPRVAAEAQNPAPVRCLTCLANIPGADLAAICTDCSPTKEAQEVRAPKGQLALL